MSQEIILPTKKVMATHKSPNNLIIFAKPKVGKTSVLAQLDNCLILDLEKGSDYVDALKIQASSVEEIKKIGEKIKEAGNPYKYVAVDSLTALEEIVIPYAEMQYSRTVMGKNWFKQVDGKLAPDSGKAIYGNILSLPNGAGYQPVRESYMKVIDYIKTWAPRIILVAHIKDILLEKNGAEFTSMDIDLTGKLKRIVSSQSDAIGYLYRKGDKNILSFKTSDEVSCGARPDHLRNKEIILSELTEAEGYKTNWDSIYID